MSVSRSRIVCKPFFCVVAVGPLKCSFASPVFAARWNVDCYLFFLLGRCCVPVLICMWCRVRVLGFVLIVYPVVLYGCCRLVVPLLALGS